MEFLSIRICELAVAVCICNPSTWEAEAGGVRIPGHLGLPIKTLFQEKKKKKNPSLPYYSPNFYPLLLTTLMSHFSHLAF
jgi:hypothetical protein